MKIPGTDQKTVQLVLGSNCCKKGDIIVSHNGSLTIISRNNRPKHSMDSKMFDFIEGLYTYDALLNLRGEDLEIAMEHYKFLRKYNLA